MTEDKKLNAAESLVLIGRMIEKYTQPHGPAAPGSTC